MKKETPCDNLNFSLVEHITKYIHCLIIIVIILIISKPE